MRILIPFGTRPEIVKLAPVVRALRAAGDEIAVVATGQHHDAGLTEVFYAELGVAPDIAMRVDGDRAERLGGIVSGAVRVVEQVRPDVVLALGDTHTVPAYCLAARNTTTPVIHLEAGLRSFNPTSVEEVNRRIAAATCALHLAPTELARRFLLDEGVPDARIAVVGNPVLDALRGIGATRQPIGHRRGVLLTAHRATNVDDPRRLAELVALVKELAAVIGPVTFPVHPRTEAALARHGLLSAMAGPGISLVEPMPYSTMMRQLAAAKIVVTDSGGLQEEASWLGVPVVVLRRSTPRWESVHNGSAVLTGLDAGRALKAALDLSEPQAQHRIAALPCPYGDGHTGRRVAELLHEPGTAALLELTEPDYVDQAPPV
jgi:UDP-N-acetylglucosamine 2-epimerase (non-hydrolysing)